MPGSCSARGRGASTEDWRSIKTSIRTTTSGWLTRRTKKNWPIITAGRAVSTGWPAAALIEADRERSGWGRKVTRSEGAFRLRWNDATTKTARRPAAGGDRKAEIPAILPAPVNRAPPAAAATRRPTSAIPPTSRQEVANQLLPGATTSIASTSTASTRKCWSRSSCGILPRLPSESP